MTFEKLTLDSVNRAISVEQHAAGKSNNAARVIHTLGEPVLATGTVGGDSGRALRADFDRLGIAHEFVDVAAPTRVCVTVIDRSKRQATELVEETGPITAIEYAMLQAKLADLLPRASIVVMSGTLAPGVPDDFYAWCVQNARHARCIIDAKGRALELTLPHRPFVVKPNREELGGSSIEDLHRAGAQHVVVTDRTNPVVASDGATVAKLNVPKVGVMSAIGSGDSLAGGVAAALHRGESFIDAVKLGIACGAANAMTAVAGMINLNDVGCLLNEVGD